MEEISEKSVLLNTLLFVGPCECCLYVLHRLVSGSIRIYLSRELSVWAYSPVRGYSLRAHAPLRVPGEEKASVVE